MSPQSNKPWPQAPSAGDIPPWLRPALGISWADVDAALRSPTRAVVHDGTKPPAAVLILLAGTSAADASVVLTHRSPTMRSHSGQIAFPGGRLDPGESATQAALREAWEETGLDRGSVEVIEEWEPHAIRLSGQPVIPVLAWWRTLGRLWPNSPQETDHVFQAPLAQLADPANRLMVRYGTWSGPAFWHDGYLIWGFTGAVLSALLAHAGWEREWDRNTVADLQEVLALSRNNEQAK